MRNSALVAIVFLVFPLSCLGTGGTNVARAVSIETDTQMGLPGPPREGSFFSARADGVAPLPAESLSAEHEAYDRGHRLSSTVLGLLTVGGLVALAAKAVATFRRRRKERNLLLQSLYAVKEVEESATTRGVPRCLPTNPFDDASGPKALGLQIERAAEASMEFGRVLGVIYFDLGAPPKDDHDERALAWVVELADMVPKLKACLRATDHVAVIDDREIVVSIALLPGRTELVGIANRLRQIGRKYTLFAQTFRGEAGFAIYPLCGYRGDELIDYARADYAAHRMPVATASAPASDRGDARSASAGA